MLDLGLDKISLRRLIMNKQKQHFKYLMKHSQGLELIEAGRELLKERLASEGENVSPETQRFKESLERAIQIYKEKRDDIQQLIDSSKEEKQSEVREDPAQMTCVIEFSNQYCPICHTTDHSLNKCAVKGCSLCLHKKHPFYKCPEKCECARRPVHLADRCPAKQAPKPIFQIPMLLPPKPHWALPGKHTTCDYNVSNIEPTSEEEASSRTSKPVSPIQKSPVSLTKGATMVNSSKSIFGQKEGTAMSLASSSRASWERAFNLGTQSNSSNQASHLIGSIPLGAATPKAKALNAPQQSKSQVSTSVSPVTKGQGLAQPSISSIGSSVTKLGLQVLQPSPLKSPKAASKASLSNGKDFSTLVAGLGSSEFSMSFVGSFTRIGILYSRGVDQEENRKRRASRF